MATLDNSGSSSTLSPTSDHQRAEHYRRQLGTIARNAALALFIMDEHQQCRYMNPAAEQPPFVGHGQVTRQSALYSTLCRQEADHPPSSTSTMANATRG